MACGATCSETSFERQVQEGISPHLNKKEKIKLAQLLNEFPDVFDDKLGTCPVTSHKINIGMNTPVKPRPRRLPYDYRENPNNKLKTG